MSCELAYLIHNSKWNFSFIPVADRPLNDQSLSANNVLSYSIKMLVICDDNILFGSDAIWLNVMYIEHGYSLLVFFSVIVCRSCSFCYAFNCFRSEYW